jgi:hypothetical protein
MKKMLLGLLLLLAMVVPCLANEPIEPMERVKALCLEKGFEAKANSDTVMVYRVVKDGHIYVIKYVISGPNYGAIWINKKLSDGTTDNSNNLGLFYVPQVGYTIIAGMTIVRVSQSVAWELTITLLKESGLEKR